ncbi:MAG: alanyl-tRNA editing protein [Candidatus Promineifilaceae bacterium]
MTDLLYLEDAYTGSFKATVVDCQDGAVFLDRSAFYPGGGGQPSDTGTLSSGDTTWTVSKVKRIQGAVGHFVEGESPDVGTAVNGVIDWERRYQLMRTHTAMHILCGVIWRDYQASVTGGDMQPLKGRMDFEFETMRRDLVDEIEHAVNLEVAAARDVYIQTLPRDDAFQIPDLIRTKINLLPEGIQRVRTVEISGLDLQADGGTHVANTKEVGHINITDYKSKGKINKRIYVALEALT